MSVSLSTSSYTTIMITPTKKYREQIEYMPKNDDDDHDDDDDDDNDRPFYH